MTNLREDLESLAITKFISEIGVIDNRFIKEVEKECGCDSVEWDIFDNKKVVTAAIVVALRRFIRSKRGDA